jgi:hypothetical protein
MTSPAALSQEQQDEIFQRHRSLGSAVKANDVEWAQVYLEKAKNVPSAKIEQGQWDQLLIGAGVTLNPAMADFLIERGANVDIRFEHKIDDHVELIDLPRAIIIDGNTNLLMHLIGTGAISVNYRGSAGDSLLMFALAQENVEMADRLLQEGAKLTDTNLAGFNALHQSALHCRFLSTEWLLSRGVDPEIQTVEGTVAVELIPTADQTGEGDEMFEILEDYSESYASNEPVVPQSLVDKVAKIKAEREPDPEPEVPAKPGKNNKPGF